MISRVQLLRNVGQFDSVNPPAGLEFNKLTLIYAENGRGKTTLASIFRSASTGDPIPITERKRLGAAHDPHIVIEKNGAPPPHIFQAGAWNQAVPELIVFDDTFVDANVCSGLEVQAGHRQNLHELILGSQGVALNQGLQAVIARIDEHNREIKAKADAVPIQIRGPYSLEEFAALAPHPDLDDRIATAEKHLSAAKQSEPVRTSEAFLPLTLPSIDVAGLTTLLARDLPGLEADAVARVQQHILALGRGAEAWIAQGMTRCENNPTNHCPFCDQDLRGSSLIDHYRGYFGQEYAVLKQSVADAETAFTRTHSADILAGFERTVRVNADRHRFWSQFCELPAIDIDTAALGLAWRTAREGIAEQLRAKQATPLEPRQLSAEILQAVESYENFRGVVTTLDTQLQRAKLAIDVVKEQAAAGNLQTLESDLAQLQAMKRRFTPEVDASCAAWSLAKAQKAATEALREGAKDQLKQYRETAFPQWQEAINTYLGYFNAGFRLESVVAADTRGGPTCNYSVVVNAIPVPVQGAAAPGTPSFKTALSTGDRNTLALAFFFATLDRDPQIANRIVVIDDPIASLDDHRTMATVSHIRTLANRVSQVFVLSHNKPFLCRLSEHPDRSLVKAIQVGRTPTGSELVAWDVTQDCLTEHDRRHELLRRHVAAPAANAREVAKALRPTIEAFFRVAYPAAFPPGTLLGPFRGICEQRVDTADQILNAADIQELRELVEYGNRFHHDTNLAWETEHISDIELLGFVRRVLLFTKR